MKSSLKIGLLLIIWFILYNETSYSQNVDPQQLISDIVEELSSKAEGEIDFTPIVEDLMNLIENPLRVNSCDFDQLARLVFLTDFQIQSLWDYIQANGSIMSIYEILLIPGFDQADAKRLEPFINFSKPSDIDEVKKNFWRGQHELFIKTSSLLENPLGYKENDGDRSKYLGSKYSLATKYKYHSSDKIEWGVNAEKDPGEQFFKGVNSKGFDYLSGYFSLSNIGWIKKIVLGDFDAGFGQGLTFWSSFSMGVSSDPLNVRRRAIGLTKHSSTSENAFLRGIGVTIQLKKIEVTGFGSFKKIDANLGDTLNGEDLNFTTIYENGLHRTSNEVSNKDNLGEYIFGGNVIYKGKKAKFGITYSHVAVDGIYQKDSTPYNTFKPSIEGRTNIGFSFDAYIKNHIVFSEYSIIPASREYGFIAGGIFKLSALVNYSFLIRYFSEGYTSQYTSAFSEGTGSNNEKGLFSGISIYPLKKWNISAFVDIFSFPWLRYRASSPTTGYNFLVQTTYQFTQNFKVELRCRSQLRELNYSSDLSRVAYTIPQRNHSARIQFEYSRDKQLVLKSRVDFSSFNTDSTKREVGFVLSQDIGYTFIKMPISISLRYSIFNTDSWNTRVYVYENDLLYSFSVPAYYSKGIRTYIMVRYSPLKDLDFWLRLSQTNYTNMDEIGQGLDKILGGKKSDIRIKVSLKF